MEPGIERAVCGECDNYIDDFEIALERDGVLLCEHCLRKWFKESFSDALEWVIGDEAITHGYSFTKKYMSEDRIVFPHRREIV